MNEQREKIMNENLKLLLESGATVEMRYGPETGVALIDVKYALGAEPNPERGHRIHCGHHQSFEEAFRMAVEKLGVQAVTTPAA